jgi:adenylyl-sulfate kinase
MKGFTLWFTGLPSSGKSTLARRVEEILLERGLNVEVLDGDEVRENLSKGLGFSKEDRDTNIRRIGFVAKLLARNGAVAITAAISPYRDVRDEMRRAIGRFVEVYVACPIDVLKERDVKGLYKKALAGEIKHFTGVDDPYEPPLKPEVLIESDKESVDQSVVRIIATLEALGYIPRVPGTEYSPAEEEAIKSRLKDLGYI